MAPHETDEDDMDPVRAACRDLLRTHGPMPLPDLAARLAAQGHALADDLGDLDDHLFPFREPEWSPSELADGRLADADQLLDGLVLTTPLTPTHVDEGQPTVTPDLAPLLQWLTGTGLALAAGGTLSAELEDDDTWRLSGPPGWMPGTAGQLLVTRIEGGRLHVDATDAGDVSDDAPLVTWLDDTYDRMRQHRAAVEVEELVLELRARHPMALTTARQPLTDLIAEACLALYGDWVVRPDEFGDTGVPPGPFTDGQDPATSLEALALHLVDDHDMTEDQADEFVLLTILTTGVRLSPPDDLDDRERQFIQLSRVLADDDPDDPVVDEESIDLERGLGRLVEILADDDVAGAVPEDLLAADVAAAGPFAVLVRRVAEGTRDRHATSNAWWLYAQALEFLDADGLATERPLRQALQAAPDHVAAAADLAWHLDDRGKAGAALGMLVEHGLGDTDWADDLRAWARAGPTSAGRNDPCPCGSGRKHKVCCAPHNGWPLIERIDWVFEKLARFGGRRSNAALVDTIAWHAGLEVGTGALPTDMAVTSMCLFDAGLLADFCDLRGPLLPADELELLRAWAAVVAGVYEVIEVEPGVGLELLDLTTGDRHEVVERTASRQLSSGEVMLTWLVPYPDGTTRVALGGVQVPVQKRASVLALLDRDPSAEDLAAWYASLYAPPRLHNTDGDPLTICHIVMQVPDHDEACAALAAVGEDAGDLIGRPGAVLEADDEAFHLLAGTPEGRTLIGVIRVDGVQLDLETNSVARIEALQALVRERVPGAEVLEDTRTPVEDLLDDDAEPAGGAPDSDPFGALDDLDPEERAEMIETLDAWMADAEDRWCDETIPALGGITPRQAADDPTRRADLVALLDEFPPVDPTPGQPRGMDPDRLRRLLGLTG